MTEINFELADFTMKYLKTHPENHNQSNWFHGEIAESGTQVADMNICGSTGCFAGWASIFDGWHQLRPHVACYNCNLAREECKCRDFEGLQEMRHDLVVDEEGTIKSMAAAARESLGLNAVQSGGLFGGHNTRDELEQMIENLRDNPERQYLL